MGKGLKRLKTPKILICPSFLKTIPSDLNTFAKLMRPRNLPLPPSFIQKVACFLDANELQFHFLELQDGAILLTINALQSMST